MISQLQDEHYDQYMTHVHSQLHLHQRQQLAQLQSLRHQQPVAVEMSPSNHQQEHVEFQTEAGVVVDACHHDDEVGMVTGGEVNGVSDEVTLLSSATPNDKDRRHSNEDADDDADDSDGDDADDTGNLSICSVPFAKKVGLFQAIGLKSDTCRVKSRRWVVGEGAVSLPPQLLGDLGECFFSYAFHEP